MKKIVCLGGGTGVSTILSGLKELPLDLSGIVTMFDSGGSSGKLRKELGVLPVGDIRQCLTSTSDNIVSKFFYYRDGGENMGNYLLIEAKDKTGSLEKAIKVWEKKLGSKASIIPVTLGNSNIVALLNNGKKIKEEENIINCPYLSKAGVKKLYLEPKVRSNPRALAVIKNADCIVIAPGKFYTSILPNLLVGGIPEAIRKSKAKKIFVCNLMTQSGNTDNLRVEDFLKILESYLGKDVIDYVIFNTGKLSSDLMSKVKKIFPKDNFIKYGKNLIKQDKFVGGNLIDKCIRKINPADILVKGANQRTIVFHDSKKLARIILNLCKL